MGSRLQGNLAAEQEKSSRLEHAFRSASDLLDSSLLQTCPEIVTLLVGPNETKMTAHKAILAFNSAFFEAALYGKFKESQTNTIALPQDSFQTISAFLTWAYSGQIEASCSVEELWVLGDRLRSPHFTNEVMHL